MGVESERLSLPPLITADELQSMVGEAVYRTRGGFLIHMRHPQRNPIIRATEENAFEIRTDMVRGLPIGFQYTDRNGWIIQSWCVDGKLHRHDDSPAMVMFFPGAKRFSLGWFKNGINHRDLGPANENLWNFSAEYDVQTKIVTQHADRIEWEFYKDGVVQPVNVDFTNVTRKVDEQIKVIELTAERASIGWDYPILERDTPLQPRMFKLLDYKQSHNDITGTMDCSEWQIAKTVHRRDTPLPVPLTDFNLWSAPFFRHPRTEYLVTSWLANDEV